MAVICSQRCYWVTDLYIDRWTGWIDCQWLDSGAYVTVELAASRCVSNNPHGGLFGPHRASIIIWHSSRKRADFANHEIDSIQIRKCC